jgi:hypothetical protein
MFGEVTTDQWLTSWGQLVGRKEIRRICEEQGVADKERFKKIIDATPEK